jgi:hypothetical protein
MRRGIVSYIFVCLMVFLSENAYANAIVGLALDFPAGTLDSVTKIEMTVSSAPHFVFGNADYGYTNMNCNINNPDDLCPGYKDIPNYLQYVDPTYDGPIIPGALGLDWQRIDWTPETEKITYMGGTDTVQTGILDGYVYEQTPPLVAMVDLYGYTGKTKLSYFDTGIDVSQQVLWSVIKFDVWAAILEDDWHLSDAILVTQTMAGMNPTIPDNGPYDINGDEKIGLQELVYILQKIAGLRSLKERF